MEAISQAGSGTRNKADKRQSFVSSIRRDLYIQSVYSQLYIETSRQ